MPLRIMNWEEQLLPYMVSGENGNDHIIYRNCSINMIHILGIQHISAKADRLELTYD